MSVINGLRSKLVRIHKFSTKAEIKLDPHIMKAWAVNSFGKLDNLCLDPNLRKPIVEKSTDVIVKVKASSVNPIDVAMLGGYGQTLLNVFKKMEDKCENKPKFPLILGRDFTGDIIEKGNDVHLKIGDTVYGVVAPHMQGCHAEYVKADSGMLNCKPESMSDEEAAGIMYTAMTAWSALKITGDMFLTGSKGKRVLVLGGSGGVGTVAIQMLKAWGAEVVTTCRSDAIQMVEGLNPDVVIDYSKVDALKDIELSGKYDIILDACGNVTPSVYVPFLKNWNNSKFITLKSPLLTNTDNHGIVGGMVKNTADLVASNLTSGAVTGGSTVRWAYFLPMYPAVSEISKLVNEKKLIPVVQKVFHFENMPQAFSQVMEGHLRGKIIISMKEPSQT